MKERSDYSIPLTGEEESSEQYRLTPRVSDGCRESPNPLARGAPFSSNGDNMLIVTIVTWEVWNQTELVQVSVAIETYFIWRILVLV